MQSQKGPTPPRTLLLLSARSVTASATLGDIKGLFVTGRSARDVTGRRQEESQRLQKSTRQPVPCSPVSRQA